MQGHGTVPAPSYSRAMNKCSSKRLRKSKNMQLPCRPVCIALRRVCMQQSNATHSSIHGRAYCNEREKLAVSLSQNRNLHLKQLSLCILTFVYRRNIDSKRTHARRRRRGCHCRRHVAVFKSIDGFANKHPKSGALNLVDHQQDKVLP